MTPIWVPEIHPAHKASVLVCISGRNCPAACVESVAQCPGEETWSRRDCAGNGGSGRLRPLGTFSPGGDGREEVGSEREPVCSDAAEDPATAVRPAVPEPVSHPGNRRTI